ncbi:MAG: serine protease [Burkholderiaceae bacterium]
MKNLQEATERICELKGSLIALDCIIPAILSSCPSDRQALLHLFDAYTEAARTVLLNTTMSDRVLSAFEHDIARTRALLGQADSSTDLPAASSTVEPVLLATTRISTYVGQFPLSGASGFFFKRDERLYLVTNRHVLVDEQSSHFPDRLEIELHTDTVDLSQYATFSIPLYRNGQGLWRQAADGAGTVDVAVIEIEADRLPESAVLQAFGSEDLDAGGESVMIGDPVSVIGFPLGFHDTVHHLAVARSATIASSYGVRFQRQGYFLTDARTHRGSSGSPVLRRRREHRGNGSSPRWQLLGVHSTRMDMSTRHLTEDESLGLNGAWYADVLLVLTASGGA